MSVYTYRPLFYILLPALLLITGCAGGNVIPENNHLTACFINHTDLYQERIYRVLKNAPGVNNLERRWGPCTDRNQSCLCYELDYQGQIEDLTAWLRHRLPLNKAIPFHCVQQSPNRLEVIFDAGFK
jgi:hypothetical protein